MQSLPSFVMFKKIVIHIFLFMGIWVMSLLIVALRYQTNQSNSIYDGRKLYEASLSNLRNWHIKGDISQFRGWELVPYAHGNLTKEQKLKIIKYYNDSPGVNGSPVMLQNNLSYDIQRRIRIGWNLYHFNAFVSDLIPVNRSLFDPRDEWCKMQNYSSDLPSVTVIICFYNEAWSTLIRTVTSVLNRSPPHLLDEIILVDDASNFNHLLQQLEDYVSSTPKVTLLRAHRRIGLMRARMLPIPKVKSPVIVFLDSHCECAEGWLEPLLQRIKENASRIVSPAVDHIHDNTFEYISMTIDDLQLGGFNWDLGFSWIPVPQHMLASRKEPLAPIKTPTISGGLLAVSKDYFEKLGMYDKEMGIWGAENVELSFKTWMCGGSLEMIPCSHVGHVFKVKFPYKKSQKILTRNFVRLAKVWLDDYAKYFYERIGNVKVDYGNITERVELRKKLKCNSFQWYLDYVIPQQIIPDKFVARGQISSVKNEDLCLDAAIPFPKFDAISLYPCHGNGGNQYWAYTSIGEIRRDNLCLDYMYNTITLFFCNYAASQLFLYFEQDHIIMHNLTKKCLNIHQDYDGYKPILTKCHRDKAQKWKMDNYNVKNFTPNLLVAMITYSILYGQNVNSSNKTYTSVNGPNSTKIVNKLDTGACDLKRIKLNESIVKEIKSMHSCK